MFSDNYINLCASKNETVTTVAEHIGLSRTAGQKWAYGSVSRKTTLKRIADYFGITVDELLAEKKPTTINGSELSSAKYGKAATGTVTAYHERRWVKDYRA